MNFPCVSGFILDPMHLVYLGVTKKLLVNWTSGSRNAFALSQAVKNEISVNMERIAEHMPSEFQRKARGLDCLSKWKAVEYRFFTLYIGPLVLKGNVRDEEYDLFMLLSVAMRILSMDSECEDKAKILYAKDLLILFVKECISIYGNGFVTYNVHSIQHIADDVINHKESLNVLSAFCFENYLGHMVKEVRGSKHPVQQVVKRYSEKSSLSITGTTRKQKKAFNKLPIKRDRVYCLGETFLIMETIVNDNLASCIVVKQFVDWYSIPLPSTDIQYYYKSSLSSCPRKLINKNKLTQKALMMPVASGGYIFTPLTHTYM